MFSVVYGVLLAPLPLAEPERIAILSEYTPGVENSLVSPITYEDWSLRSPLFEELAAFRFWENRTIEIDGADPVPVLHITPTADYFRALGWSPAIGRTHGEEKAGVNEAVLSHDLWMRLFQGDRNVLGKSIRISGASFVVVGVMPPIHKDISLGLGDVWTPVHRYDIAKRRLTSYRSRYFRVIGRLKKGVTIAQAQTQMTALQQQLALETTSVAKGYNVRVETLEDGTSGAIRPYLLASFGAVAFVRLIACANVANLMLTRAAARSKEFAVRMAMGANRRQLAGSALAESFVLALFGGGIGLVLGYYGLFLMKLHVAASIPRLAVVEMNWPVLLFAAAVVIVCALLFCLTPVLAFDLAGLQSALKESGRSGAGGVHRQRIRALLVASEIALAVLLLTSAGLLLKSFARLLEVHPGFETADRVTADVILPVKQFEEVPGRTSYYRDLFRRLKFTPGIRAAGGSLYFPCRPKLWLSTVWVEGSPVEEGLEPIVYYNLFAGDYFTAMGIPLRQGRLPTEAEMWEDHRNNVLINETMARQLFTGSDPIGKRFKTGKDGNWLTIIGVVGDVRQQSLDRPPKSEFYVPFSSMPMPFLTLVASAPDSAAQAIPALRAAVQEGIADVKVHNLTTLDHVTHDTVAGRRIAFGLILLFALLSVSLATVGIYGVMSYAVSQRTSELGVRLALGATPATVWKLVTWQGLKTAMAGVGVGVIFSLLAGRAMGSLLFSVAPWDLHVYLTVPAVALLVAVAASLMPACRASRVDPLTALRHE
jgi:putative ABC transport system permease protein